MPLFNYVLAKKLKVRAYSRHLLGATIAPNLVSRVLKKIFLLITVKNDIRLVGASKPNALFSKIAP